MSGELTVAIGGSVDNEDAILIICKPNADSTEHLLAYGIATFGQLHAGEDRLLWDLAPFGIPGSVPVSSISVRRGFRRCGENSFFDVHRFSEARETHVLLP